MGAILIIDVTNFLLCTHNFHKSHPEKLKIQKLAIKPETTAYCA